ncbi:MAG: 4-hydroxy-tetrahydrodipicolinate reductase [Pirellulaceae bacterium]
MVKLGIHGAGGRMGQRLVALAGKDDDLDLVVALEHKEHPQLGADSGLVAEGVANQLPLVCELDGQPDVIIDFSVPQACDNILHLAAREKIPLVVATTGLTAEQQEKLKQSSQQIPIVWAPNMSLAVNLTMKLVSQAAAALSRVASGVDVEIIDRHHRFKEDSPSGTALRFGELIASEMGQTVHQHGRQGILGQRPRNEIGYHALRVGDNPGEHSIVFGMLGEMIELTVRSTDRDCYAMGALEAAKFVAGKPVGIYSMFDVLNLNS